jgi:hypothetical protein
MKTPILYLSLFFIAFSGLAQDMKSFSRKKMGWKKMEKISDGVGGLSEVMVCTDCQYLDNNRVPYFVFNQTEMECKSAKLVQPVWKSIPFWEMAGIDTQAVKEAPEFKISTTEQNRKAISKIGVCLVRKQGATWERLHEFSIEVTGKPFTDGEKRPFTITSAENSFLNSGQWLKMGIVQTGVYQITGAQLAAAGLQIVGKNSAHIRMFGSGGKMLSEANRDYKFDETPEIAIQVEDGGDGVFDSGDRVLFYGQEPNSWLFNATAKAYQFQKNIYSDTSYYFVTYLEGGQKRVQSQSSNSNPDVIVNYYPERWVYSPDNTNVLSAGREWYADVLDFNTVKNINFPVSNLICDSLVRFRVGLMARSGVAYPFSFKANGNTLSSSITPSTVSLTATFGNYGSDITYANNSYLSCDLSNVGVTISYEKQGNPQSIGYLNYVEMNAKRRLSWTGTNFGFRSTAYPNRVVGFDLAGYPSNARIWNVTYPASVSQVNVSGGTFAVSQDTLLEFFAFADNNLPTPPLFKMVQNQNIRGMEVPDMIIVTHPRFMAEANRLAEFRRENDKLSVEVVEIEKVYNEFSSGSQDVTAIRNMAMLHFYKDAERSLKYLLLFGDCSFDFKNRITNNTNFVPVYQGAPHLNIVSSYASDDYFGILSRTKGGWESNDLMDIGVGRLPAKNIEEAKILVDKVISYEKNNRNLGPWRTKFTFVADDGDGCTHSDQANDLAETIRLNYCPAQINKVYIGAYNQVANAGGFTSPDCTNDIVNAIENGSLLVNYTGHGGETVWADEYLFTNEVINRLKNKDRLSFFITATCDFGRHDLPAQVSGAENLMLHSKGGAIGVLTTGRPVNAFSNKLINDAFYKSLIIARKGFTGRMGDVMMTTKNINSDKFNNRGFSFLGDPSTKFGLPEQDVAVTSISKDTIQGLDLVEFSGEIRNGNVLDSAFNGNVFATVYDRPSPLQIHDNEPTWGCKTNYSHFKNVLYNGSEKVNNGKFRFQFFASKDVSYQVGLGKISIYARDNEQIKDGAGCKLDVKVGGINPNPIADDEGPIIRPFMNDTSFINYGLVGTNANLLVFLEDSSGINTSGQGLGHDLTATLDGSMVYILNSYYQSEEGNYKKGSLSFPLRNLSFGTHTLTIKAWDNFNNSNTATITFEVGGSEIGGLLAKDIRFFPNPFFDNIYISLENAFAGSSINIDLQVSDILGRPIVSKSWDFENSTARPGAFKELAWDGSREDGTRLPAGTYLCQIRLKSDTDGAEYKIHKKIILLH